ncbi:MAG TPA: hypothetical protein VK623_10000 [Flavobacterium sp.]|nr:hypothetical protein [Flavobacterium sp.]
MNATITTEKDFLFVITIKNESYYQNQAELSSFIKTLPASIRLYGIIHAGLNTVKVYCVTNNYSDYEAISEREGIHTEIVDTKRAGHDPSASN